MIGHDRSRREALQSFRDDLGNFDWLFWNLHRERLACIDRGEDTTLWFTLVCDAIKALHMKDYAQLDRALDRMTLCV